MTVSPWLVAENIFFPTPARGNANGINEFTKHKENIFLMIKFQIEWDIRVFDAFLKPKIVKTALRFINSISFPHVHIYPYVKNILIGFFLLIWIASIQFDWTWISYLAYRFYGLINKYPHI